MVSATTVIFLSALIFTSLASASVDLNLIKTLRHPPNGILDAHIHLINVSHHVMWPLEEAYCRRHNVFRTHNLHDYNVATGSFAVNEVIPIECGVVNATTALLEVDTWRQWASESSHLRSNQRRPLYKSIVPYAPLGVSSDLMTNESLIQYFNDLENTAGSNLSVVGVRRLLQIEEDPDFACNDLRFRQHLELMHHVRPSWFFDLGVRAEQLRCVESLVSDFPSMTFVLDHIGKPNDVYSNRSASSMWRRDIAAIAAHQNVYIKISGLVNQASSPPSSFDSLTLSNVRPYIEFAIKSFGYNRSMFTSNWFVVETFSTWASWYYHVLAVCNELRATDADLDLIFRKTATDVHDI